MFEQKTFENILQGMLGRVPNDVDKREGSIIYDALAPAAMEIAQTYADIDLILRLMFADTADGEFLEKRVAEHGIYRKQASTALRKGVFVDTNSLPLDVPLGSRFRLNNVVYVVERKITSGEFALRAETSGAVGNIDFGILLPIEQINGLGTATLIDVMTPGEDVETDNSLRNRFLELVRLPITSGNVYHYKKWTKEVAGVGEAKITPIWDGPGTVKIVIVNSEKRAASSELVTDVYNYIEENRPIGATVTVISCGEIPISISANITLANGYTIGQVKTAFERSVIQHFADLAFNETYVSFARIGNLLLDTPGVGDYSDLKINSGQSNILLGEEEIPVLNSVSLGV
ncbi:putative phage Mu protein gp47-like protein [Schinkia azotoformans MEV2011]|uniref:Putative phage Mu protein gp47-like protein n=1 Tax=Schinkia azotoformans MEV2011 TaxID=1348973 RepID=A0A072P4J3_SCHAZ|nr:baseplate J/gp47 family protein [Schinkia azotoformans]KEF40400.1 putative phage Mu protein gp47-like protein [Schinkia azotoformans MEV2011]MEC1696189.1 baseplate J/gp47 family protein [Schinkia azotoformans]MEC1725308.1 baseplate J/gp47 family protein [Schinkia azotoformans]MEC1779419.1 baseplate J/gp47 family protein [Schinkia azotoformans]MED4330096.1 baseplate J/gp47 family protein [Schinkia azotoformans]